MRVEYDAIRELGTYVEGMPGAARQAAKLALNDVTQGPGLTRYREAVGAEIDFPAGYLNRDRLHVERTATTARLEVEIVGRDRPTSLARFVRQGTVGKYGVTVEVKRGERRTLGRAFPITLRNGNKGLALRLRPGETLRNTVGAKAFKGNPNLYLLYGPSVDQVFREVSDSATPEVLKLIEQEFYRQFFRLANSRASR